ncbi:unannotated protein [freshwater metagenome]|uniref:Unannotated protein n=1 Tax=freshwater metagenome TaxID=449393 RepID=A0A6J6L1V0_9ZZZZ
MGVPRFEPFPALRFSTHNSTDVGVLSAPPYDVFDEDRRNEYAQSHPHNIVHVDYPIESEGPQRYDNAATVLNEWIVNGVLTRDTTASFSIYRMTFTDDAGRPRTTIGVIGALEVVDEGAGGVLPHERTTPKAKTDRLDLTRATQTNLSPVWGLSLSAGLTDLLIEPGDIVAQCTDEEGVHHVIERVDNPDRVRAISACVSAQPVLIADGHHRYAISRTYRDEARNVGGPEGAELTMTYVGELIQEQLSVAAIHRLYDISANELLNALAPYYSTAEAGKVDTHTIAQMDEKGCLCLVDANGNGTYLIPNGETLSSVRELDSSRLEFALSGTAHEVSYQHGVKEVLEKVTSGQYGSAILIRPVSLTEIRRTADTGELMPPKSTFFTPKLRTGMVLRPLKA